MGSGEGEGVGSAAGGCWVAAGRLLAPLPAAESPALAFSGAEAARGAGGWAALPRAGAGRSSSSGRSGRWWGGGRGAGTRGCPRAARLGNEFRIVFGVFPKGSHRVYRVDASEMCRLRGIERALEGEECALRLDQMCFQNMALRGESGDIAPEVKEGRLTVGIVERGSSARTL